MSNFQEQNINRKADEAWRNKECATKQCQFKKKLDQQLGEGLRRDRDNREKRQSSSSSSSDQSPSRKIERERRRQLKNQLRQKERLDKDCCGKKKCEDNKLACDRN